MHRYRGIENFSTGIELVLRFDLLGFDAPPYGVQTLVSLVPVHQIFNSLFLIFKMHNI